MKMFKKVSSDKRRHNQEFCPLTSLSDYRSGTTKTSMHPAPAPYLTRAPQHRCGATIWTGETQKPPGFTAQTSPSSQSDPSLCQKGRIALRTEWKLSTLIWLRRTRFLRGAVAVIHSDFLQLRTFWLWVQSDHVTDQFSCPERACMSLMFHSKNSFGEYFKSKLPPF